MNNWPEGFEEWWRANGTYENASGQASAWHAGANTATERCAALEAELAQMTEERDYFEKLHRNKIERARKKGTLVSLAAEQRVYCPKGCGLMYLPSRADDHSCMDS